MEIWPFCKTISGIKKERCLFFSEDFLSFQIEDEIQDKLSLIEALIV